MMEPSSRAIGRPEGRPSFRTGYGEAIQTRASPSTMPYPVERRASFDALRHGPPPSLRRGGRRRRFSSPASRATEFTQVLFARLFMELRGGLEVGRHLVAKAGRGGGNRMPWSGAFVCSDFVRLRVLRGESSVTMKDYKLQ